MPSTKKVKKKKYKILLAEDDKYIAKAFFDGLSRAGFKVINVYNGQDVIVKLIEEQPDILLLDLIMPTINGFEALEIIKKDRGLSEIPVVVFSNLDSEEDISRAKDLGAIEYLLKADTSIDKVVAMIQKIITK